MALERKLSLNELRCLYDLAEKEKVCAKRAPLIYSFSVAVFTSQCWHEDINDAKKEYDDKFEDYYYKKTKTAFNKICEVRTIILKYLDDNNLEYLLDEEKMSWLKLEPAEDVVLIIMQFQAAVRVLDLLESEHSGFVKKFKEFRLERENPTKNKYNFAFRCDALDPEIYRFNRISPSLMKITTILLQSIC